MSNNIRITFLSVVICLVLLLRPSRAVNVVTNGYEFTIAIADGVQSVNANNQAQFLNNLQVSCCIENLRYSKKILPIPSKFKKTL